MRSELVIQDLGPANSVTQKLAEAANEVRLTDPQFPNCSPDDVLRKWSYLIRSDYESRSSENLSHAEVPDLSSITATANQTLKDGFVHFTKNGAVSGKK